MFPVSNVTTPPQVGAMPPGMDAFAAQAFGGPTPPEPPPDPYADDTALLEHFSTVSKQCADRRTSFERIWWRTILYLLGRQWIYYERMANQWVDKRLQKWVPRPVTNKMAEGHETILSVFQSVELAVSCRPEGGSPKDIMAADTANKYEAPLRDDHQMMRVQDDSDWWLTALGNVFWFTWWDYSGDSQIAFVPWERCVVCQKVHSPVAVKAAGDACPECGSPILNKAVDEETGEPIGMQIAKGHGRTDAISPLEVAFPPIYANFDDSPVVIRRRWRSKDYLEQRLTEDQLKNISWESSSTDRSLQMLRSLASMTEIGGMTNAGVGGEPSEIEGVTEAELWEKPSKAYPEGLVLRVIDGTTDGNAIILRMPDEGLPGPLPFTTNEGRKIWPWLHTGYEKFGGRGWARSPLERIFGKQDDLNQHDSLVKMITQRMTNPVWVFAKGSEPSKITGEPGLMITYNPLGVSGTEPKRIEGANIPASLPKVREQILADIETLLGTQDVLKGNKPAGVEAFSAMQLLVERAQSRYGKVLAARGVTYQKWFKIAIDMERKYGSDERAYAILGPNGGYNRIAFKKQQLDGSIKVGVEDGSQMPKTSLGKRAAIQQLQALSVIDAKNPETGYAILEIFGQTALYPGLDAQVMGARRVQQAFEDWANQVEFVAQPPMPMAGPTGALIADPMSGQPMTQAQPPAPTIPPPGEMKAWQEPTIYLAEYKKWASGDVMQELMARKPEIEPYVTMMIVQFQQAIAMAEAAAQQAANPQDGKGKDGQGVGGGRAMANSNQESGKPGVNTGGQNAA